MEACGGSEKGDMRAEKRVQIKMQESKLEHNRSESEDAQVLLTCMAYDILLVLIEIHHGILSVVLTLWAFLELENAWMEVEQERVRIEWKLSSHV